MAVGAYPRAFGKYVLLRPLARGGMGEIFLAAGGAIGGFEKLCVIKKVLTDNSEKSRMGRFLDEAKVVVRLQHANLVTVFDAGDVDGEFYIAMEYVEGKNLREVWNRCALKRQRIPVDVALYLAREVCRGLGYAHGYGELGLVHRDVSPPNVLLSYFGEIKLTDFGLARSILKQEKTAPGVVYGRYAYLAPEQARGEEADLRTDLYAVGIILWELLTGQQLFGVQDLDPVTAISLVRSPKTQPPSSKVRGLTGGIDSVVMRALAPRRDDRYVSADEMRAALSAELAQLSPGFEPEKVAAFLRTLYGDKITTERAEREHLLREDLPAWRKDNAPAQRVVRSAPGRERTPEALLGATIDSRYKIERVLGAGGMGTVYEATHVAIGKRVALKVLKPEFAREADLAARFRREARAASATQHPNIVDISDFGETEEGDIYFVMELLAGEDLAALLARERTLTAERAIGIAVQVCRALAAAHGAGIVHRDLKPENIFLCTREGRSDFVKVVDFGIAKAPDAGHDLTSPGIAMGTPEYMSPEQAMGRTADARSDVYALGAILYETLAGTPPFHGGEVVGILSRKVRDAAPPLRALRGDVPPGVERLVLKALEIEPSKRQQSMGELEQELVAVGRTPSGRTAATRPPSTESPAARRPAPPPTPPPSRPQPAASLEVKSESLPIEVEATDATMAQRPSSKPRGPAPPPVAAAGPSVIEGPPSSPSPSPSGANGGSRGSPTVGDDTRLRLGAADTLALGQTGGSARKERPRRRGRGLAFVALALVVAGGGAAAAVVAGVLPSPWSLAGDKGPVDPPRHAGPDDEPPREGKAGKRKPGRPKVSVQPVVPATAADAGTPAGDGAAGETAATPPPGPDDALFEQLGARVDKGLRDRRYGLVRDAVDKARASAPGDARTTALEGRALKALLSGAQRSVRHKELDDAEAQLRALCALDDKPYAHRALADVLYAGKRWSASAAEYRRVLDARPKDKTVAKLLAKADAKAKTEKPDKKGPKRRPRG